VRPRRLATILGVAALAAGSACTAVERPEPKPDVLLVVLDTVRADRLSAYGYARPTSPHLAALADEGVLFEDVTAPSNWTWPSHASLFTGTTPWEHGAHFGRSDGDVHFQWGGFASPMRRDLPTLAERLAAAGYRTVFLSANPVLGVPVADSITRGFEVVEGLSKDRGGLARAREAIEGEDPRPLFLFVNLMGAHNPYEVQDVPWLQGKRELFSPAGAPPWLQPLLMRGGGGIDLQGRIERGGRTLSLLIANGEIALPPQTLALLGDLYDGELVALDATLADLVSAWRGRSGSDSIVAVTSDHGEYLGEHGLVEHTYLLYDQVLKVPLVLHAPGRLPAGVRIGRPVQLQDLYATLLDLALGEEEPTSLARLVSDSGAGPRPPIRAIAYPRTQKGVASLGFVYRYYREGNDVLITRSDGLVELYDVGADPGMTVNLAASRTERVAALAAATWSAFREVGGEPGPPVEITPGARQRLNALGYTEE